MGFIIGVLKVIGLILLAILLLIVFLLAVILFIPICYQISGNGRPYEFTGKVHWLFGLIQFITHTIVDYITSRINKKLWESKQVHNFFVMIGFDQFIHYVILFSSLTLLFY